MKFGIIVFPGSNCDHDAFYAASECSGQEAEYLWHKGTEVPGDIDCIIIPGGFSYGDYLRSGAIARFSPIMNAVKEFAEKGGTVIGICNGFQILTEMHMLPGALLRNKSLHFLGKDCHITTVNNKTRYSSELEENEVLRIPIAHGEGNYFADPATIQRLEDNNQVVFRYSDENGTVSDETNPNGSINNIAGIVNEKGNVLGMMPHPERHCDKTLGSDEGMKIFRSIINFIENK